MDPNISVIIPAYNAAATLRPCLEAVFASDNPPTDCIVVDDGSTDGSQTIARSFAVDVITIVGGPFGPAYARNRGAEAARGDILFFVDSDVVVDPAAIRRVAGVFQNEPDVAAVFGSYDDRPLAFGVISQYRNLLHHFVHQNGNSEASTFWAGCGAIRRPVFEEIGGFDEKRFRRASIEDIELGYRLQRSGCRIRLEKTLQGTHLKKWTLFSLIRTDITCRALPWARLILETKKLPNDLNLKWGQRLSFALVALSCMLLVLTALQPGLLAASAAALVCVGLINRDLYAFFYRQRGALFAAACIPLHLLYYLYSGLAYVYACTEFQLRRTLSRARRKRSAEIFRAKSAKDAKF